jgi:hypothetical protein
MLSNNSYAPQETIVKARHRLSIAVGVAEMLTNESERESLGRLKSPEFGVSATWAEQCRAAKYVGSLPIQERARIPAVGLRNGVQAEAWFGVCHRARSLFHPA